MKKRNRPSIIKKQKAFVFLLKISSRRIEKGKKRVVNYKT